LGPQTRPLRRKVNIERTFKAPIEDVWELWTTQKGVESWWGPAGFTVTVRKFDVRPGGELAYTLTATDPEQIEFLKKAGMPVATDARVRFTEVVPLKRLAFTQLADFIPNVQPYQVATTVDFEASSQGVRMVLVLDAMHDEQWTKMAVMGWESQLEKLARLVRSLPSAG
jgi:uncharacterized protein YndB with AHSA1/START domain